MELLSSIISLADFIAGLLGYSGLVPMISSFIPDIPGLPELP